MDSFLLYLGQNKVFSVCCHSVRALLDITSRPEVQKINKIRTVQKPDVFLPRQWTQSGLTGPVWQIWVSGPVQSGNSYAQSGRALMGAWSWDYQIHTQKILGARCPSPQIRGCLVPMAPMLTNSLYNLFVFTHIRTLHFNMIEVFPTFYIYFRFIANLMIITQLYS